MNNSDVHNAFHGMEKLSKGILLEVDTFMKDFLKWADYLKEIIEKGKRESCSFSCRRPPNQRRTYTKKASKVFNSSSCSVQCISLRNETCNLDGTISSRTRNARRTAASKVSEVNVTKNENHKETIEVFSLEESLSSEKGSVIMETPVRTVNTCKTLRAVSESPAESTSPRRISLSGSPVAVRGGSAGSRNTNKSLRGQSSGSERSRSISGGRQTRSGRSNNPERMASTPEQQGSLGDRTITIKKQPLSTTFVVAKETNDNERTPLASHWSSPGIDLDKTPVVVVQHATFEENQKSSEAKAAETTTNAAPSLRDIEVSVRETEEAVNKPGTEQEKQQTEQPHLSNFAKKVLNKVKIMSANKYGKAALLESHSSSPGHLGNLNQFLASSTKTPRHVLKSGKKDRPKRKVANKSVAENLIRTVTKPPKDDLERGMKLRSTKEKKEEGALNRQNVIKFKQENLRRDNELKHQTALKQREKLEQQKYNNTVQSEKEKEERRKLILQERQAKVKKEAQKRKMLKQQKIAETDQRRRIQEEARTARMKKMKAEEQTLAAERPKGQERPDARAQERLAQKKVGEEYEMQVKKEQEVDRLKREWDFRPRNEHDYGLEEEHSEVDSEDENICRQLKPAMPWAIKILHRQTPCLKRVPLEMLCEFVRCHQKSPDIEKMFKMSPSKKIKRTSSAIWNTSNL